MKKLLILLLISGGILTLSCEKKESSEIINDDEEVTQINENMTENIAAVTQINEDRWVSGEDGIRMREFSDSDSDTITIVPRAAKVKLLEETGDDMIISGQTGKWSKIEWNNQTGWAFGGFLSEEELMDNIVEGNIFNAYEVNVGDNIAGQKIISIDIREADDGFYLGAFIDFKGKIEISGEYRYRMFDEMFGEYLAFTVNESDYSKIPILENDTRGQWFMIDNLEQAKEMLDISGNSDIVGKATIVIEDFEIGCYPSEVWNSANVINVLDNQR